MHSKEDEPNSLIHVCLRCYCDLYVLCVCDGVEPCVVIACVLCSTDGYD